MTWRKEAEQKSDQEAGTGKHNTKPEQVKEFFGVFVQKGF